jgi:Na+-driven multidrug efflux pump
LIPAVLVLPIYFGVEGALWSGPVADVLAGIITAIIVIKECQKISSLGQEEKETQLVTNKI